MKNSYFFSNSSALAGEICDSCVRELGFSGGVETLSPFTNFNGLLNERYRLLKLLGQGGFGKTFLAVDEQQGATSLCVIKQLFLQGSSIHHPKASELFHQEAQQLAELGEHPQIPKLLNTFEQDGQAFIVQEWIDGWTLEQEIIDSVPFDEIEIRQVLRALLPVLQYLHDHQIIHRDIKPANIICRRDVSRTLRNENRQFVLVDFGAAKHLGEARSLPTQTLIGSAEYAAPEQLRGHAVFASDLYSLGMVCLHLLTQMSPFDLYDVGEDEWKWQVYLTNPISPSLKQILGKLLQSATRRRYRSAAEVLADLDALSILTENPPARLESAIEGAASASRIEYSNSPKQLSAATDLPSAALTTINSAQAVRSISSSTIYIPETQEWYDLTPGTKTSEVARKVALFLGPRLAADAADLKPISLGRRLFKTTTKDAVELVFGGMLLFMLTCIGSMALICFFFEMERRSSTPHPEIQPSLLSSPTRPVK